MKTNPIAVAVQGKGGLNALRRIGVIGRRYGLTPGRMDRVLAHFREILARFDCDATFAITGAALARSRGVVEKYQEQNIEFAVHGYYHVDHARLSLDQQLAHLTKARRLFHERGVACQGFRSPYLRWSEDTVKAVRQFGYLYDSSEALNWSLAGGARTRDYERVLSFYGAIPASAYPSLPGMHDGLVRIPYCLPDDEALVDRLELRTTESMTREWQAILAATYELGELFTLGLHPERVRRCQTSLIETLRQARAMSPRVWIARLDEIARWWKSRADAAIDVVDAEDGDLQLDVRGPDGVTILARGVEVMAPTTDWVGAYRRVMSARPRLRSHRRPFIGVSASTSPRLVSFLKQQGYIVEFAENDKAHSFYIDRADFRREDERSLLAEVELSARSIVRLGRWPWGARSALCVTGDIDALTIWDYGLRLLGG